MSRHFKATKSSELSLAPYRALYTAVAAFGDFEQMWIVMYTGYFFLLVPPQTFENGKIPTKKGKQRYVTTINNVFNPTFTFLVGILSSSILFGVGPENKLLQKSNY